MYVCMYYSQRAVFASLWTFFSLGTVPAQCVSADKNTRQLPSIINLQLNESTSMHYAHAHTSLGTEMTAYVT